MTIRTSRALTLLIGTLFLFTACAESADEKPEIITTAAAAPAESSASSKPVASDEMLDAVATRQAVFKLMKQNFGPLYLMAREKMPFDAEVATTRASRVNMLMGMIGENFTTDTRGQGVTSGALDAVWADPEAFQRKIDAAKVASSNLAGATGSLADLQPAFGRMGKACGSCHDDFREEDD